MPVTKRRPHITELLNIAVEQYHVLAVAKAEMLQSPSSIWTNDDANDTSSLSSGSGRFKAKDFLSKTVSKLPFDVIVISRFCEQVYLSSVSRFIRFVIILLAVAVMVYEAPRLSLDDTSGFKNQFFIQLDQVVNSWFLFDCVMRFGGIPIRIRIEEAFNREIDMFEQLANSAIPDVVLVLICFGMGLTTIGLWVRLARLMFLTAAVFGLLPHLQVLVSGLGNGLKSIFFTFVLLFVAIIIYAAFGHALFADNDPFHFGTISLSMWSFFQVCIFDSWYVLFYVNFGGCDSFPSEYVLYDKSNAAASVANILDVFPNANPDDPFDPIKTYYGDFVLPICSNPQGQPVASVIIFCSFVFVCGYFVMSLNLATVAIGIIERLEELRNMELYGGDDTPKDTKYKDHVDLADTRRQSTRMMQTESAVKDQDDLKAALLKIWEVKVLEVDDSKPISTVVDSLHYLVHDGWYQMIAVSFMVLDAALEIVGLKSNSSVSAFLILLQVVFSLDVCIHLVVYIFTMPLKKKNKNDKEEDISINWKWLLFNGLVTTVVWVPLCAPHIAGFQVLHACRSLRLLYFLKYLSRYLSELDIIIRSISSSFVGLVYVLALLVIFFFYFAVAGTLLFKESDPYNFSNVYVSMKSQMQVLTMDTIIQMMRINMFGCHYYGYNTGLSEYDSLCHGGVGLGWISALYFIVFIILGGMVLVSLLVGVIITSMELLREGEKEEYVLWEDVRAVQKAFDLSNDIIKLSLELFEVVDKNQNSKITFTELQPLMYSVDILEADQFEFYMHVDRDSSGQIDFSEFCELISIIGFSLKKTAKSLGSSPGEVPNVERPSDMEHGVHQDMKSVLHMLQHTSGIDPIPISRMSSIEKTSDVHSFYPETVKQRAKSIRNELSSAYMGAVIHRRRTRDEDDVRVSGAVQAYGGTLSKLSNLRASQNLRGNNLRASFVDGGRIQLDSMLAGVSRSKSKSFLQSLDDPAYKVSYNITDLRVKSRNENMSSSLDDPIKVEYNNMTDLRFRGLSRSYSGKVYVQPSHSGKDRKEDPSKNYTLVNNGAEDVGSGDESSTNTLDMRRMRQDNVLNLSRIGEEDLTQSVSVSQRKFNAKLEPIVGVDVTGQSQSQRLVKGTDVPGDERLILERINSTDTKDGGSIQTSVKSKQTSVKS